MTDLVQGDINLGDGLDGELFALLRAIDGCGSINRAARLAGLSYKRAWSLIERGNRSAARDLLESAAGGSGGGGSRLTPAGRTLLALYEGLRSEHALCLERLNRMAAQDVEAAYLLRPVSLQISMANRLFGALTELAAGAGTSEAVVRLKTGELLRVALTPHEAAGLDLTVGGEVLALIDSQQITLCVGPENLRFSARNQFWGVIERVEIGAVEAQAWLRLSEGARLTAQVTRRSALALRLHAGMQCWAVFKSNAVWLATPGRVL